MTSEPYAGRHPRKTALAPLIEEGLRTRHERARAIFDRCRGKFPQYRDRELPEGLIEEAIESGVLYQTLFYEVTLAQGRAMHRDELAPLRERSRSRVELGLPLGDYLAMIQESFAILVEDLLGRVHDDAAWAELRALLPLVHSNAMQLMAALTETYVEERERLRHDRDRELFDFFELLLYADVGDGVLETCGRRLGLRLGGRHSVAVFRAAGSRTASGADALQELRRVLGSEPGAGSDRIGHSREGFAALLASEQDPDAFAAAAVAVLGDASSVGVGRAGEGLAGVRRSAREALRALEIGSMLESRPVYRFADIEILDLVNIGSPGSLDFMRCVLGGLATPDASAVYLDTLHALSDHGFAIKPAAAALSVHPHTLSYRMRQIRARHGIDLDDPRVRLRVHLALEIREAVAPAAAPR